MEPRPVSRRSAPKYPSRREFLAAASAAAASLSGCGKDASASAVVAPIFAHGEGRGATGCIVVASPVFLSEEEALQVVREEFSRIGITLGEGLPLPEVTVEYEDPDARWFRNWGDNWLGEPPATVSGSAELTAVDRQQRVGVTIVTSDDCRRFRGPFMCSVSSYDTRGLAQSTADALRQQAKRDLHIGVFYDPLEKWDFTTRSEPAPNDDESPDRGNRLDQVRTGAAEKSRAQLRRQVQDFVAWLQQNG
jgi:hypothetical protein